jgi:hypothetical protein
MRHHSLEYGISGQVGTIDNDGIVRWDKWRYRSCPISCIASLNGLQKARQTNILALQLQLTLSSLRSRQRRSLKEYLYRRIGKYNGTHISAIGNEAWRHCQLALTGQ